MGKPKEGDYCVREIDGKHVVHLFADNEWIELKFQASFKTEAEARQYIADEKARDEWMEKLYRAYEKLHGYPPMSKGESDFLHLSGNWRDAFLSGLECGEFDDIDTGDGEPAPDWDITEYFKGVPVVIKALERYRRNWREKDGDALVALIGEGGIRKYLDFSGWQELKLGKDDFAWTFG